MELNLVMIEKVGIIAEENKNARLEIRPALNNSHALKCECTPYYVIGKLLTLHLDLLTSNKSNPKS